MNIVEYAKLVDARDKAQQEYFAHKRKFKTHSKELFDKSCAAEREERRVTKMILESEENDSFTLTGE